MPKEDLHGTRLEVVTTEVVTTEVVTANLQDFVYPFNGSDL